MSAFTQNNGPQGGMPSTTAITQLIAAYATLSSELHEHMQRTISYTEENGTSNGFVHGIQTALQQMHNVLKNKANAEDVAKIEKVLGVLNSNDKTSIVSKVESILDDLNKSETGIKAVQSAHSAAIDNITGRITSLETDADSTNERLTDVENELKDSGAIKTALRALEVFGNLAKALKVVSPENQPQIAEFENVLLSAACFAGSLYAHKYIDFTEWHNTTMQFAGTGSKEDTGTNGLYIIGKVSSNWQHDENPVDAPKSCRAFVKYINSHPFDAIVDITVTKGQNGYTGSICANVSKADTFWNNLRFHLIHATDTKENDTVYLAMSADVLDNSSITVRTCGINFIPLGTPKALYVKTVADCIVSTTKMPKEKTSAMLTTTVVMDSMAIDNIVDTDGNNIFQVIKQTLEGVDTEADVKTLTIGNDTLKYLLFLNRPVIQEMVESPDGTTKPELHAFVTDADVNRLAALPIGTIIQWPAFEEVIEDDVIVMRKAINVPTGWHATDGSIVPVEGNEALAKSGLVEYADDVELHIQLPLQDFSIIKTNVATLENVVQERNELLDIDAVNDKLNELRKEFTLEAARRKKEDEKHDRQFAREEDSILSNDLNSEVTRASAEENRIKSRLDSEITRAGTEENRIESKLNSEIARAGSEESRIENKLNSETARASGEESRIDTKLDSEITRSTDKDSLQDSALREAIASEEARTNEAISATVKREEERATETEQNLESKINEKVNILKADIDSETETRKSVNNNLLKFLQDKPVYSAITELPNVTPDSNGKTWETGDKAVLFDGINMTVLTATVSNNIVSWS